MFYSAIKCATGGHKAQNALVETWTCEVRGCVDLKTQTSDT